MTIVLIRFVLGKEKLKNFIIISELYFFKTFYSTLGTEKEEDFLLVWNLVGGRVGYQA